MRLGKTERARAVLDNAKSAGLDLRDRRILILADGKRTRDALIAMLGIQSGASIDRLVREGYLALTDDEAQSGTRMSRQPRIDSLLPSLVAPAPVPAPEPARTVPASARRSLAATKMYLVDMLQLQRTPAAAEWRLALQRTSDPVALIECMADALAYLLATTPPSYGDRVRTRVCEVIPEEWVSRFASVGALAGLVASSV